MSTASELFCSLIMQTYVRLLTTKIISKQTCALYKVNIKAIYTHVDSMIKPKASMYTYYTSLLIHLTLAICYLFPASNGSKRQGLYRSTLLQYQH